MEHDSIFKIDAPEAFWLLWLIPLLWLFCVLAEKSRQKRLKQFASVAMIHDVTEGFSSTKRKAKTVLTCIALIFLILSLTQFKLGFIEQKIEQKSSDIVIALDISESMLAQDVDSTGQLSRLERAKREIQDLLKVLRGDRVAFVFFSGDAFVQCPLTADVDALEMFLDEAHPDMISSKGTNIGAALDTSLKLLESAGDLNRAIVLLTDGEDLEGQALDTTQQAQRMRVPIFTMGLGKVEGAPVPEVDGGFKQTPEGSMVLSKLDEPTLQKIALTTGGRYVRSVSGDLDLEQIYHQGIQKMLQGKISRTETHKQWEDRYQWPVFVAFILLCIEYALVERRLLRRA